MASKKSHEGEEPVGWVTVKGVHFPKWADGSIGWDSGTEKKDFKTMKKEADQPHTGYSRTPVEKERNANPTDKFSLRHEMFATGENLPNEGEFKFMSMSEKINANGGMSFTGTNIHKKDVPELIKRLQQSGYEAEIKKDFYIPSGYNSKGGQYGRVDIKMKKTPKADAPKPVSKNAKYDTSRANNKTKSTSTKKKPTALEAFKENSNQMINALKEGQRQNALEVHYTDMTGKTYKHYWNGVKFTTDKVKQDMAKKYGKKAGIYKASFKKPKEWE